MNTNPLTFEAFALKAHAVAALKFAWLDNPEFDDLRWSFLRKTYWVYSKRPAVNLEGFILSMFRQEGSTAEHARVAVQPASIRFGPQTTIDDSALQAFIDPAGRHLNESPVAAPAMLARKQGDQGDDAAIDTLIASFGIRGTRSQVQLTAAERASLPKDYLHFLQKHGTCEFADGITLDDPWASDEHVKDSIYWVIGSYWEHADGDDLLLDPASGKVFVYLHEQQGKLQLFAPSFTKALALLCEYSQRQRL